MPSATNRMTRSSLRSSLHRFGSGATASYPPKAVLTPGLAALAGREQPARLPGGRAAWPNRLHAAGSRPACQEDGHARSPLDARRAPTARLRAACRAACRAGGRTVLLAGACGRRPLGRIAPAASEASPDVSTDRRSGMTSCAPLPSGAGRSEATTALYGSSSWQDGLACRPPGLGFGPTLRAVSAVSIGRVPVSSWHRARRAMSRRRRAALVDGKRAARPRAHPPRRTSAPDERLRRHRARARPNGSCPERQPTQRPGGRQANPPCQARRAV